MLPPNPTSLLPWSVLVPVMQLNGCFPYRLSAKGDPPVFSLHLFLWAVLLQLMKITALSVSFARNYMVYLSSDVGTATYFGTLAVMMFTLCAASILLGMRSRLLATLLHEISSITCVSPPPGKKWCNLKTIRLILFLAGFSSFAVWYGSRKLGFTNITGIVIFMPACLSIFMSYFMPEEVSSMVFGLLARRLVAATETVVAKVSSLLAPDGSCKCDSDVDVAVLALRDLDAVIREVGRNSPVLSCLVWIITARLQ